MSLQNSLPFCIIKHAKKKISDQIKRKYILVEIHFVAPVADIFNRFLLLFQKDEPLIHILHSKCVSLVLTIMERFLRQEVYAELGAKELPGTRIARCDELNDRDLALDGKCKSNFDIPSSGHKSRILNGARGFYGASLRHLLKKFPLKNTILRCCKVLHPDSSTSDSSLQGIRILGKKLTAISVNTDKLIDERN